MIRNVQLSDANAIAEIYNHYVLNGVATFEENTVSEHEMAQRIDKQQQSGLPWLVLLDSEEVIVGYAYGGQFKTRSAYRFSVESTVYLKPNTEGNGYGTRLYQALFEKLRSLNIHVVIGIISLPNDASVALHEKMGMKKAAHFEEVGYKFGKWIDVGYWQVKLNG